MGCCCSKEKEPDVLGSPLVTVSPGPGWSHDDHQGGAHEHTNGNTKNQENNFFDDESVAHEHPVSPVVARILSLVEGDDIAGDTHSSHSSHSSDGDIREWQATRAADHPDGEEEDHAQTLRALQSHARVSLSSTHSAMPRKPPTRTMNASLGSAPANPVVPASASPKKLSATQRVSFAPPVDILGSAPAKPAVPAPSMIAPQKPILRSDSYMLGRSAGPTFVPPPPPSRPIVQPRTTSSVALPPAPPRPNSASVKTPAGLPPKPNPRFDNNL